MGKINEKALRNANLYVLSHAHHHGLIFAQWLKTSGRTGEEPLKRFVADFRERHLATHFEKKGELIMAYIRDPDMLTRFIHNVVAVEREGHCGLRVLITSEHGKRTPDGSLLH